MADRRPMDAAPGYAARGWRVMPIYPPDPSHPSGCACHRLDCTSPGKHPMTRRGVHDATTDPDIIQGWQERYPDANVGIATGTGLVVLDVDPRNGGDDSLHALEEEHDWIRTLTIRTGGGGLHLYLAGDLPARNGFRPGLDLKAAGGYVVAPGSWHVSGRRYEVVAPEDLPENPAPVPDWLRAIIDPPRPRLVTEYRGANLRTDEEVSPRYMATAIERECLEVATAPEGARNDTLNRAAFALARFTASGADPRALMDALTAAALHAGLREWEIRRTLASAFRARRAA